MGISCSKMYILDIRYNKTFPTRSISKRIGRVYKDTHARKGGIEWINSWGGQIGFLGIEGLEPSRFFKSTDFPLTQNCIVASIDM